MTGSGTPLDPYLIYDVNDLQAIENDLSAYYELANDIDASVTVGWNGGAGFLPIGDWGNRFTGSLDGKGYTVDSLFINRPLAQPKWSEVGVFSYNSGTIQNINFTNCDFTGHNASGMVNSNYGSITNCSVKGSIVGATAAQGFVYWNYARGVISQCSFEGSVDGEFDNAGFAQYNEGEIGECHADAVVTSTSFAAAGFVWSNSSTISKSYSEGSATGESACGFALYNYGTVENCYSRCSALATSYGYGFAEYNDGAATIKHCYSTGVVSGATRHRGFSDVGGVIEDCFWDTETSGQSDGGGGTGKTTAQMKTKSTFTDAGWDFSTPIWYITPSINDGYPCFEGVIVALVINKAFALAREEL